jgi:hypothetical protein
MPTSWPCHNAHRDFVFVRHTRLDSPKKILVRFCHIHLASKVDMAPHTCHFQPWAVCSNNLASLAALIVRLVREAVVMVSLPGSHNEHGRRIPHTKTRIRHHVGRIELHWNQRHQSYLLAIGKNLCLQPILLD